MRFAPSFVDKVSTKGMLEVLSFRGKLVRLENGRIAFNPKETRLVDHYKDENLVVITGRTVINEVMNGTGAADPISYICLGTGGYSGVVDPNVDPNPPLISDDNLYAQILEKQITTPPETPNSMSSVFSVVIENEEGNGLITEFGLKTASKILFARRTTRPLYKDADVFFVVRWTVQF